MSTPRNADFQSAVSQVFQPAALETGALPNYPAGSAAQHRRLESRRYGRLESLRYWYCASFRSACLLLLFLSLLASPCFAQQDAISRAGALETQGKFSEAALVLQTAMRQQDLAFVAREQLEFELDRLRRIKLDYPFTKAQLLAELKKSVRSLSAEEYEKWIQEGRFDTREIDGQRFFMAASVSNLFFRYPELYPRRLPAKNSAPIEKSHWETCVAIKKQALAEKKPYVLPKRFSVTMEVSANADAAPDGQIIRAWLPIPRRYPFQSDFELVSSSSTPKNIDDETSQVRSVYLEQTAHKNKPTRFQIQYDYTAHGVWFDIDPEAVRHVDTTDNSLKPYLQETSHVQFTPQIRQLSQQIAGAEENPYVKAKKFYEWIAGNIKYSFATEYSTIRNISEYCRSHGYGDCGQEALLFITLCRLNSIPARWQSGWTIFPGAKSNHDWTEIYLAPYGWIPVDPYMGIYATHYATTLSTQQREEIRDFYFGGLDQYRLIANSDHNQLLKPAKRTMRSDDVDFQRGELEWGKHNIYFDQFDYNLTAKELSPPAAKIE